MRISGFGRYALTSCVAGAMLAGCGGSQSPVAGAIAENSRVPVRERIPASGPSEAGSSYRSTPTRKRSGPLLYVANTTPDYDDVKIYRADVKDPSPIAVITDGIEFPFGDCIDSEGTLYVTNMGTDLGFVSEYAAGKTTSTRVITEGINIPVYCAIDGKGNLWVTNVGNSSVVEYRPDATKPSRIISDDVTDPHGIAFDRSGNMYVSNYSGSYKGYIAIYAPGRKAPSRTITDGIAADAGVAVDAKGTLYVANSVECNIQEYLTGHDKPYQEITADIDGPQGLVVGSNGWLYVTNTGIQNCKDNGPANVILEFAPGSVKPSSKEVRKGVYTPGGSAYSPPLLP